MWVSVIGLLCLFVALRWNNFNAPLVRDEGEYAYAAQLLRSGSLPYEHSFLQKPPMVVYSYALANLVAPGIWWGPRALACMGIAAATVLLGWVARKEFGVGTSLTVMWLFTPMVLLPELEEFTANTEMFMLLPLLALIALYVANRQRRGSGWMWLLAGFVGAVAVLYKYTALPIVLFIMGTWWVETWRRGKSLPELVRGGTLTAIGAGVAAAASLAVFFARDGGRALWECTIIFNRYYAGSGLFNLDGLQYRLGNLWSNWWILFLLPLGLAGWQVPRMWFWLSLLGLGLLSTGGNPAGHYYLPMLPAWALLAAVAIRRIGSWANARLPQISLPMHVPVTAVALILICLSDYHWLTRSAESFAKERISGDNPFLESVVVAKKLSEISKPGDKVYVAGSEPQILSYARRFSPTRFVIAYPMTLPTPLAGQYQREAIEDLRTQPPAFIVLARSPMSWLMQLSTPQDFPKFLDKLLKGEYEPVGAVVFDEAEGRWQEPVTEIEIARSSLVLYQKKGHGGANK